jgi:indolepyruvate ferredoxin oxidoreductase beta subunit
MKEFNLIISGVGGQGVLTLGAIIIEAALKQKYEIKTSELHGLAQRGGHVSLHIRFGEEIYSPLILSGRANLIIGLEPLETLRVADSASKQNKTIILTDTEAVKPLAMSVNKQKYPELKDIIKKLKKFSSKVIAVDASDIARKEVGNEMLANVYLLGYLSGLKLIPIKEEFFIQAIKEMVREKYLDANLKIFDLGKKKAKK